MGAFQSTVSGGGPSDLNNARAYQITQDLEYERIKIHEHMLESELQRSQDLFQRVHESYENLKFWFIPAIGGSLVFGVILGWGTAQAASRMRISQLRSALLQSESTLERTRLQGKRTEAMAGARATRKFATGVLQISDDLRRVLDMPKELLVSPDAVEKVISGVDMTETHLKKLLFQHKIIPISTTRNAEDGAAVEECHKFDPKWHEAVSTVNPKDLGVSYEDGEIVEVLQVGYTIEDTLLRPSRVVVAKTS